jgi:hypothetical protein
VHVGAIVTVPSEFHLQSENSHRELPAETSMAPIARWELLGKTVLDRVLERLQVFGVGEPAVISEQRPDQGEASTFWDAWDAAISKYLQFDLQTLLLLRVGPYIEVDIADWLRFHRETASAMSQVYDQHGALDLVAIDARRLVQGDGTFRHRLRALLPKHQRYRYSGYSNRLSDVRDFHRLSSDALQGRAALRPIGREIEANVWAGENARIDEAVQIVGPAFIGRNSHVHAGCRIHSSTIEQDCHIDCGTNVKDSCVLAGSYVGAGLKIQGGIVAQETFFHLGRNVRLQFRDHRLMGKSFNARGLLPHRRAATAASNQQGSAP